MKDIWMYLLPSGFIASLLTWLVNRRRERLKDIREEHSVYRELYEDLRVLIKKQEIEHGKLRRKIYRLERVLEEVGHCRHRHQCPLLRTKQKEPDSHLLPGSFCLLSSHFLSYNSQS